jgi:hypothetical protein
LGKAVSNAVSKKSHAAKVKMLDRSSKKVKFTCEEARRASKPYTQKTMSRILRQPKHAPHVF